METSDAGVIAAPRWIEPPDYGTGMLFLRRSRRVFCRIGKLVPAPTSAIAAAPRILTECVACG